MESPVWFDLGSGNGSPAIPIKLAKPAARLTMVESKERKAAFLREAVRSAQLGGRRWKPDALRRCARILEERVLRTRYGPGSRIDPSLFESIRALLRFGGQVLLFGANRLTGRCHEALSRQGLAHLVSCSYSDGFVARQVPRFTCSTWNTIAQNLLTRPSRSSYAHNVCQRSDGASTYFLLFNLNGTHRRHRQSKGRGWQNHDDHQPGRFARPRRSPRPAG